MDLNNIGPQYKYIQYCFMLLIKYITLIQRVSIAIHGNSNNIQISVSSDIGIILDYTSINIINILFLLCVVSM